MNSRSNALPVWRFFVLCLCVAASSHASAHTQKFQASWEQSSWQVETSKQYCRLSHQIPRFGRVRFEQQGGHRLQFILDAVQPPTSSSSAVIYTQAPPWKHSLAERSLGNFPLVQGKTPMRIPRDPAMRIYYELEQGMQPVIEFSDWGDGKDQVRVSLSPVRFREVLPEFTRCTDHLLHLDFEPIGERIVYFNTNSDRLSRPARRVLEEIARDYRKQKNFRVVLGGHADERGKPEHNMTLSKRRASMAARYLRSRGVPAKIIETRSFGESQPADPAANQQAWTKNRRVTVWLAER